MANVIIGLDLGNDSVKAAVLRRAGRKLELVGFHQRRIVTLDSDQLIPIEAPPGDESEDSPEATIEDGGHEELRSGRDPAVLEAARDLLDALDAPGASYVVAVPGQRSSNWIVELPFDDVRTVDKVLPGELATQVPFPMEDMVMDWRMLESEPGTSRVLAVLVPRADVRNLLGQLTSVGLDPRHVGIDSFALGRLAPHLPQPEDNSCVAIVDIGRRRTLVNVSRGAETLMVRTIDRGGEDLTAALSEAHGLDMETVEENKRMGVRVDEVGVTGAAVTSALDPLIAQLRATLLSFEAHGDNGVGQIYVCGGGSKVLGLADRLEEVLGVPVAHLPQPELPGGQGPAVTQECALALALGLTGAETALSHRVELRTGEFAYRRDTRRLQGLGMIAALLVALFGCWQFVDFVLERQALVRQTQDQQDQIVSMVREAFPDVSESALSSTSQAVAILQERVGELSNRQLELEQLGTRSPLAILKALSDAIPTELEVNVDNYEVNEEGVRLSCNTKNFETADQIVAALQKTPRFAKATKGDQTRGREGQTRFVVSIPFTDEEVK